MSDLANYNIAKIKLTNFFDARIIEDEASEGRIEKGLFIPLDKNDLRIGRHNEICAWLWVNKSFVANEEGWTHYFQLRSSESFAKKMNEMGYKMPYMGYIKPASYQIKANLNRPKRYVPIERKD